MKKVYLIRHAESYQNVGQSQFKEEALRLTDLGIKQSIELASNLEEPSLIVVSKYLRAILTAEPLFLKYTQPKIEIWRGIHEFNYLSFSNIDRTDSAFKERENNYWNLLDPEYRDGKGVDTFSEFMHRVIDAYKQIHNLNSTGNIYIFTHHDFIKLFLILGNHKTEFINEVNNDLVKTIMQEYRDSYSNSLIKNTEIVNVSNLIN